MLHWCVQVLTSRFIDVVTRNHEELLPEPRSTVRHVRRTASNSVPNHQLRRSGGSTLHSSATTGRTVGLGNCARSKSEVKRWRGNDRECFEKTPLLPMVWTYFGYGLLFLIGFIREILAHIGVFRRSEKSNFEPKLPGFATLLPFWEKFYAQNIVRRVNDCFNRPVTGVPGVFTDVLERETHDDGWNFKLTGKKSRVINLGSWNFFGFAGNEDPFLDVNSKVMSDYGVCTGGSLQEIGYLDIHRDLEKLVADYLGTEAAIIVSTGFATNALNMPCLVGKGCLILSDQKNHASMILGSRLSGAITRTFEHNNMMSLEEKLREAVIDGQPRTHRPWKKILITVEGVYSMDGSVVNLPAMIALKKKYKAYLYIDEAHSLGAIGPHGGGVVDYFNVDPADVDVLMGTFSKSFSSSGGYIAGSRPLIKHLRVHSHSSVYCPTMSAPLAAQIITSLKIIMGKDGTNEGINRIRRLKWNVQYFRRRLKEMGFLVYGNKDSPTIPILMCVTPKATLFSRECLRRGLGVVCVGYPATPLVQCRARLCMSAALNKDVLDRALAILDEVGDLANVKYSRMKHPDVSEPEKRPIGLTLLKQSSHFRGLVLVTQAKMLPDSEKNREPIVSISTAVKMDPHIHGLCKFDPR